MNEEQRDALTFKPTPEGGVVLDLDVITKEMKSRKPRAKFRVGQRVEYNSSDARTWLPATIKNCAFDTDGEGRWTYEVSPADLWCEEDEIRKPLSLRIKDIGDLEERHREMVINTVRNLGLDMMFKQGFGYTKETDSPRQIARAAWEMLADGVGENEGLKYFIDEFNHMVKHYSKK